MNHSVSDNSNSGNTNSISSAPLRGGGGSSRPSVDVAGSLRRHWLVATLIPLIFIGCGAFFLLKKAKPDYESHSVVYLSPKFPKLLAGDTEVELPYESYVQDQIQTVTRHDIIADSITKLPYAVRYRRGLTPSYVGPALPYEIQLLQKQLEVKRVGSSYEVTIGLHGPTPNDLAEIVNTVTDTYVERTKNEEFYGLNGRLNTLRQEKISLQKQMDDGMAEQAHLMEQVGVATMPSKEGGSDTFDSTTQKLNDQLVAARMQREAAEAQLATAVNAGGSGGSTVMDSTADEAIAADPGLSGVRSSLISRRAALQEEMNGLRPDHPVYQKDKEELASIDGMMADLRRKAGEHVQDKLRQDVARTRMIELQLTQELAQKTQSATAAAPKFQKATALGPEIDSLQKAYSAVDDRIRDLELESSSPGSIHISSPALTPLNPEASKLKLYLLALIVISFALAVGAPVAIDFLDKRIYTAQDVEQVVGFHPLGVLLDNNEFKREIAGEYYLRMAAGIDHSVRSSGARIFLFTSPTHESGTSTIVKELSDKLRGLELRTQTFVASATDELELTPSDIFSRSQLLLQRRKKTEDNKLATIAPVASIYGHKEFGMERDAPGLNLIVRGLQHVGELCDVILIDASPLPISAHTEYLARVSDVTILVVKSGSTTKQELDRSARLLERLDVAGVGVVLNQISMERADRAMKKELRSYEQSYRQRRPTASKATKETVQREKVSA
jgi:uncharacterized protein involved in exopolysaccharide biosynthesis